MAAAGAWAVAAWAADAPPPPPAVEKVPPEDAEAVLGQRILDHAGKTIGRLVDVLVDGTGQPRAAVIDFGGFMGVGNRKVAVHWNALQFNPGDPAKKIVLNMTPDQIKAAPEYRNVNQAAPVVTPADTAPSAP
ncbi:MAG TPA: PRC-barrel domain-containing protein [Rhodopila sp.]|nr:PRC-barrel domain-containing protein [Rhodopila sp.]